MERPVSPSYINSGSAKLHGSNNPVPDDESISAFFATFCRNIGTVQSAAEPAFRLQSSAESTNTPIHTPIRKRWPNHFDGQKTGQTGEEQPLNRPACCIGENQKAAVLVQKYNPATEAFSIASILKNPSVTLTSQVQIKPQDQIESNSEAPDTGGSDSDSDESLKLTPCEAYIRLYNRAYNTAYKQAYIKVIREEMDQSNDPAKTKDAARAAGRVAGRAAGRANRAGIKLAIASGVGKSFRFTPGVAYQRAYRSTYAMAYRAWMNQSDDPQIARKSAAAEAKVAGQAASQAAKVNRGKAQDQSSLSPDKPRAGEGQSD